MASEDSWSTQTHIFKCGCKRYLHDPITGHESESLNVAEMFPNPSAGGMATMDNRQWHPNANQSEALKKESYNPRHLKGQRVWAVARKTANYAQWRYGRP